MNLLLAIWRCFLVCFHLLTDNRARWWKLTSRKGELFKLSIVIISFYLWLLIFLNDLMLVFGMVKIIFATAALIRIYEQVPRLFYKLYSHFPRQDSFERLGEVALHLELLYEIHFVLELVSSLIDGTWQTSRWSNKIRKHKNVKNCTKTGALSSNALHTDP